MGAQDQQARERYLVAEPEHYPRLYAAFDVSHPEELMRCGAPSAMRTRTTAKRATRRPFVPRRQLSWRHLAPSSLVWAASDLTSRT
jgi:hypothetical protein